MWCRASGPRCLLSTTFHLAPAATHVSTELQLAAMLDGWALLVLGCAVLSCRPYQLKAAAPCRLIAGSVEMLHKGVQLLIFKSHGRSDSCLLVLLTEICLSLTP